jgi:hypothetical protein
LERLAKGTSKYGALPPPLVIICLKEILSYEGLPKALKFKAAEGIDGDTHIVIQVADGPPHHRPSQRYPRPMKRSSSPTYRGLTVCRRRLR